MHSAGLHPTQPGSAPAFFTSQAPQATARQQVRLTIAAELPKAPLLLLRQREQARQKRRVRSQQHGGGAAASALLHSLQ